MKKNIYLCGPTVYSVPHIGNMRPILSFDIYIRSLILFGYKINFIHNITDIDDKIIEKAIEKKVSEKDISTQYTSLYLSLLREYNVIKPTVMPKVTDNISGIIDFIRQLIDKNHAYELDGNVYFDVSKWKEYGNISNQKQDKLNLKETNKKSSSDFALWKKTNIGVVYNSPWAKGRPGWHTECSFFVNKLNNANTLDLHGGGIDLIFPHHENENIQFWALNKKNITKKWKHVGQLEINGSKMSKSIGNVWNADDFLNRWGADVLRYIFLTSSVTIPISLSEELLVQAKNKIEKYKSIYKKAILMQSWIDYNIDDVALSITKWEWSKANRIINEKIKNFNKGKNNANEIIALFKLIGFKFANKELKKQEMMLYNSWEKAKEEKDFKKADAIRIELIRKDII